MIYMFFIIEKIMDKGDFMKKNKKGKRITGIITSLCVCWVACGISMTLSASAYEYTLDNNITTQEEEIVSDGSFEYRKIYSDNFEESFAIEGFASECSKDFSGELIIPDSFLGIPVSEISKNAFSGQTGITSVAIPESVDKIGDFAFNDCTELTDIKMGENISKIGMSAFGSCISLNSVSLPDNLEYIGPKAFQICINLQDVNIPSSVYDIGADAFFKTKFYSDLLEFNLENNFVIYDGRILFRYIGNDVELNIPNGVELISGGAFSSNETIETINLPDTIKSISRSAFDNLFTLHTLNGIDRVSYIGRDAFCDCSSLDNITISGELDTLMSGTFFGCKSLSNISLSYGISEIGTNAFTDCTNLELLDIPKSVNIIKNDAFDESLVSVFIGNSECVFEGRPIKENTYIHGYAGSTAEMYAIENGNSFYNLSLSESTTKETTTTLYTTYTTCTTNTTYTTCTTNTEYTTITTNTKTTTITKATGTTTKTTTSTSPHSTLTTKQTPLENKEMDIDDDDKITVQDAAIVLSVYSKHSANLQVDDDLYSKADVNKNGVVDMEDAIIILQYYAMKAAGLI